MKIKKRLFLILIYFLPLLILSGVVWLGPQLDKITELIPTVTKNLNDKTKPEPNLPWLSTKGRFIVNAADQPIILRGVNVASTSWGYQDWFPKAIEKAAQDWGANVIRTRIYQEEWQKDPNKFYRQLEETILSPARQNDLYVILNPWINQNDPLPDEITYQMWQDIARHYQDDPTIIYDVLAEPHDVPAEKVRRANIKLIETIRAVHSKSLILVTGIGWGREINSYYDNPLDYNNLVYRTNPYNKPGEFQAIFGKTAAKYPVFLGEFGADGYPPMSQTAVKELLRLARQLNLGWTAWNFHSVGCPCLLSDYQDYQISPYGEIVKKALDQKVAIKEISTPEANQERFYIYSDYLENGFHDLSWDAEVDFVQTENYFAGQAAIKTTITKDYGALNLASYLTINPKDYNNLTFSIRGSNLGQYKIQLLDKNDRPIEEVNLSSYLSAGKQWYKATIPLIQLNPSRKTITGLAIKDSGHATNIFYLDEVFLE